MNRQHCRTLAALLLSFAIVPLSACGNSADSKTQGSSTGAPEIEAAASSQSPGDECKIAPDAVDRLIVAGRPIPSCVLQRSHSFGDERRTPSR